MLDAAADRYAVIFRAPKTGNLNKVYVRFGTVAVGAGSTLAVSFFDVSATSGDPDETSTEYTATIPNGSITTSATVKSGAMVNAGSPKAVTQGQLVAFVAKFRTFNSPDTIQLCYVAPADNPDQWAYYDVNLTGSYAKQSNNQPVLGVEYDDGSYAPIDGVYCVSSTGGQSFSSSSTPDEYGLLFSFPFRCQIDAAWVGCDPDGDLNLVLYSAAGATTLISLDKDLRSVTTGKVGRVGFTAAQTIEANTNYVLACKPTSATAIILGYIDVPEAACLGQWYGGTGWQWASAKDPTTRADFTATTTRRPSIGLRVSAIDGPTGPLIGGGKLVG